jgi:hypothetical protein
VILAAALGHLVPCPPILRCRDRDPGVHQVREDFRGQHTDYLGPIATELRWLVLSTLLRELLEGLRMFLKVSRECPNRLGHLRYLRCELIQLRGELGPFDGWHLDTRGRNEIAHNSEGIVKLVDLFGQMAKAKQIEGGHVLEESHAVDRFPFDYPGLFDDPLDLIFGTDSCGHSHKRRSGSSMDVVVLRPCSICGVLSRDTRCARLPTPHSRTSPKDETGVLKRSLQHQPDSLRPGSLGMAYLKNISLASALEPRLFGSKQPFALRHDDR